MLQETKKDSKESSNTSRALVLVKVHSNLELSELRPCRAGSWTIRAARGQPLSLATACTIDLSVDTLAEGEISEVLAGSCPAPNSRRARVAACTRPARYDRNTITDN